LIPAAYYREVVASSRVERYSNCNRILILSFLLLPWTRNLRSSYSIYSQSLPTRHKKFILVFKFLTKSEADPEGGDRLTVAKPNIRHDYQI